MRPPLDRLLWTCSLLLAAAKQTDSPSRSATAWKPAAIMTQNWAKSNRGNRMFPRSYSPASCRSNIAARQIAHGGPAKPPRDHRLRAADVTAATTRLYTRYAGPSASLAEHRIPAERMNAIRWDLDTSNVSDAGQHRRRMAVRGRNELAGAPPGRAPASGSSRPVVQNGLWACGTAARGGAKHARGRAGHSSEILRSLAKSRGDLTFAGFCCIMQIGIRELRGKCVRGEPSRVSLFCRLWGTQDGAWKRASVRGAGRLIRIIL